MFSIKTKPTIEKSVSSYPSYLGKELYKLFNFRNYFDHELLLQYSTHPKKTYGETNGKQKILAGLSRLFSIWLTPVVLHHHPDSHRSARLPPGWTFNDGEREMGSDLLGFIQGSCKLHLLRIFSLLEFASVFSKK